MSGLRDGQTDPLQGGQLPIAMGGNEFLGEEEAEGGLLVDGAFCFASGAGLVWSGLVCRVLFLLLLQLQLATTHSLQEGRSGPVFQWPRARQGGLALVAITLRG
ncbi:hypothetical protein MAPG_08956 [Magnaporthiopsis poae ATCC 64411]|uniref:Uncharacterized protein n=1 Tax=Magnaporthiopsis poae (strain ATCC 64411 / 73-15) TaxID=644358 RepID=A0A0C4E8P1_MAGP6|nr:hypothetical protein MAPG_08956 [Magnaporthiopsis poae ATCC 64411]